ncbi:DoxX family membrane protein [Psychroflexus sp. CAK57W]|uniref:DoxX family protein n=1 Tax=Psychroflexus curvus TaxID=2873595 RepID=UPI001CCD2773|nr:DoxX family membrane protein [Psychroflexus curvus]MBZ9786230.1 DoxX family membrane protein [Psychroflexus curvus]
MNPKLKTLEVSYVSVVLLRSMLSLIFIVASISHFINTEKTINRIKNVRMGFLGELLGTPKTAVILSGVVMLIAGIALLIGFKTRLAALVLIAVLIPITLTVQVGQVESMGPLFKNIALLGGLLFFSLNSTLNYKQ